MGYAATMMFVVTQSEKTYRNEGRKNLEYSPLISLPRGDKEGVAHASPQSAIQLIRQGFLRLPPPPTPPPTSRPSLVTSPIPPPSLP